MENVCVVYCMVLNTAWLLSLYTFPPPLCRGFVYCRNEELEPGWVAFGSGNLLHRPVSFDNKPHSLFQVIDQNTLQVKKKTKTLSFIFWR